MATHKTKEPAETLGDNAVYENVVQRLGPLSNAALISELPQLVVVISGPSGVGKDSVVRALQERRRQLHFVVTATSRAKRPNEVDGVDYHFVSKDTFEEWIAQDRMFEYAMVYGDYKGVPKSEIEDAFRKGEDCVLRLDVQGAAHVRKMHPHCVSIFLSPHSEEELVKRLISRKTETVDDMVVRVKTAREELRRASEFDYVVVNRQNGLDAAVTRICSIMDAEKSRRTRLPVS